jgi:hypothetical protein
MDGEAHDTLTLPLVARCRSLCDESRAICQRSAHLRQESAALWPAIPACARKLQPCCRTRLRSSPQTFTTTRISL